MEENKPQDSSLESLEAPETNTPAATTPAAPSLSTPASEPVATLPNRKQKLTQRLQNLITHINIYLLLFVLLVIIAVVVVFVGLQRDRNDTPATLSPQELNQEALENISGSETKVGDPKQTLSFESNAIFSGKVLVRDSLDVAGTIKVGGALNLLGITVSGTSNFDQVQANRLAITGDATVQGTLSVQRNITAAGASFSAPISAPQLNVQTLQLGGDLSINRHIDAGGPTPGASSGTALGIGGTASVGGTDTAGTVTVNTGSSPGVGCFITVNFATKFNATPHVVITPVGSGAAELAYYINRSATNFSICTASAAAGGQSFAFDYIVID